MDAVPLAHPSFQVRGTRFPRCWEIWQLLALSQAAQGELASAAESCLAQGPAPRPAYKASQSVGNAQPLLPSLGQR